MKRRGGVERANNELAPGGRHALDFPDAQQLSSALTIAAPFGEGLHPPLVALTLAYLATRDSLVLRKLAPLPVFPGPVPESCLMLSLVDAVVFVDREKRETRILHPANPVRIEMVDESDEFMFELWRAFAVDTGCALVLLAGEQHMLTVWASRFLPLKHHNLTILAGYNTIVPHPESTWTAEYRGTHNLELRFYNRSRLAQEPKLRTMTLPIANTAFLREVAPGRFVFIGLTRTHTNQSVWLVEPDREPPSKPLERLCPKHEFVACGRPLYLNGSTIVRRWRGGLLILPQLFATTLYFLRCGDATCEMFELPLVRQKLYGRDGVREMLYGQIAVVGDLLFELAGDSVTQFQLPPGGIPASGRRLTPPNQPCSCLLDAPLPKRPRPRPSQK